MFILLKTWFSNNILIGLRTDASHSKLMLGNHWTYTPISCERLCFFLFFWERINISQIIMSRRRGILAKKFNFENFFKYCLVYFILCLRKSTLFCFKWISKVNFFLSELQIIRVLRILRKLWVLLLFLLIFQSWMVSWFIFFIDTTLICCSIQRFK